MASVAAPAAIFGAAAPAASTVERAAHAKSMESAFGVRGQRGVKPIKGTCVTGEVCRHRRRSSANLHFFRASPFRGRALLARGRDHRSRTTRSPCAACPAMSSALGGACSTSMINTPTFRVRNPAEFNELGGVVKPDPNRPRRTARNSNSFWRPIPRPSHAGNYLAEHSPPRNYFSTTYFGVHSFKFVDSKGAEHLVKWRFVPRGGESILSGAEVESRSARLSGAQSHRADEEGSVQWDMVVYVGQAGDPETDPTQAWPESREHFTAGTLSITQATPQPARGVREDQF